MSKLEFDLCIIGGGINGAGIARDAAGRGLSVLLVEAGDLASATSSASSKLIHGGLRYLEYFEFRLVRESLKEREILLRAAPHIVRPMNFIMLHDEGQRPAWMIRAGLFLYDRLGGRKKLPASQGVDLKEGEYGAPLKDNFKRGFSYADCWADDARLVALNALDAAERGAHVLTRMACVHLQAVDGKWDVTLRDMENGSQRKISAAMVINAAGPWTRGVLEASDLAPDSAGIPRIRLVKGSHIIVPRQYEGEQVYVLQQPGKRIVFVIPYEQDYTLIGTTEEEYNGDPVAAHISEAEASYLCRAYNNGFKTQIAPQDIIWTYSGVRPLFDDGQSSATSVTRDYRLYQHLNTPPMISVFGGKLTTYRRLAEEAVDRIMGMAGRGGCGWTEGHALPGGDITDFATFAQEQVRRYSWLPADLAARYARSYGTRMNVMLQGMKSLKDLGADYGEGIYESELRYLIDQEWARSGEDVLWRRSKLGLHITEQTARNVDQAVATLAKEKELHGRINASRH